MNTDRVGDPFKKFVKFPDLYNYINLIIITYCINFKKIQVKLMVKYQVHKSNNSSANIIT